MPNVTRILSDIEAGDQKAAEELMPIVYEELRKLAQENPDQTLQATALVHEAYLRLVDVDQSQHWNSRGHFFCSAAEAMRRIVVDNARRKNSLKRGSHLQRIALDSVVASSDDSAEKTIALDEALSRLAEKDPLTAC